jgi:hypothetical protein
MKERNSTVESFRILAAFTVLVLHYIGWYANISIGKNVVESGISHEIQSLICSATCICVNMFLVISGFFGMKFKLESVIKIGLTLFFIHIPCTLVISIYKNDFAIVHLIDQLFVLSNSGYFIQCYLMLMFFSPVLNSFIESKGKNILPWVLSFCFIEFYFGCVRDVEELGFNRGFSVIHFILMYMVARCLYLYKDDILKLKRWKWVAFYCITVLINYTLDYSGVSWAYHYSNPMVVLSSVCIFVPFLYKSYTNRKINKIAQSTLTVYILCVIPPLQTTLIYIDGYMLTNYSYVIYLLSAVPILCIAFVFSVCYDRIIRLLSNPLLYKISPYIKNCNFK